MSLTTLPLTPTVSVPNRVGVGSADRAVLAADDPWNQQLIALSWVFVAVGVLLRVGRYLAHFPFWGDELMFVQSFLDRDYAGLLQPLIGNQVAPLGFLAVELTSIKLFGFSEWSLRLFAIVTAVGGMFLFRDLAARVLDKVPMVLAVAIFAVSYYPIRHAAECKPYGSDLTASLLLVWLAVRWYQSPAQRGWLWGLAVAAPLCITFSYPTIFVAGAISLALAWPVWQSRDRPARIAFVAFNLLLVGVFLLLLRLVTGTQYASTRDFMVQYWAGGFPPWRPLALVQWLVSQHAGEMMAYPFGADRLGSLQNLICFAAGVAVLVRRRQRMLAILILAPLGLAFIAAALHRYPYGGARLSQYYASLACLAVGLGAAALITRLGSAAARRRAFGTSLVFLLVVGSVTLARDMSHPYKNYFDFEHREFARWFWHQNSVEAEVVCLQTDLGRNFYGDRTVEEYACVQRACSPLHRHGSRRVDLNSLPPDRPLRCVSFHLQGLPRDEAKFREWLDEMSARYELQGEQTYRIKLDGPKEPDRIGEYIVYEFRARQPAAHTAESPADPSARR